MANPKRAMRAPKLKQPPTNERPEKHRPTAAEKDARVSTVMTMLLSGSRRIEICEFGLKQWGIQYGQTDRYIADATALIKASADKTRDEEIIEHVGRMDLIFRFATGEGDYSNAIKAAQDKAKLRGLYPSEKHELITKLDDGQLAERINSIVMGLGIRLDPPDSSGIPTDADSKPEGAP